MYKPEIQAPFARRFFVRRRRMLGAAGIGVVLGVMLLASRTPDPFAAAIRPFATQEFPAIGVASFPMRRVPNWGAMASPAEWNRRYDRIPAGEYVRLPRYDLRTLTTPTETLLTDRFSTRSIRFLTAKLTYSTRYFGSYDLDAGEFTGPHPGIDLKLPAGMPVGAVAGGRVNVVFADDALGLTVIIEHRARGDTWYSVYGHLESAAVRAGEDVQTGTTIGAVGMTGITSAPHLHLQIDRGFSGETPHAPFRPSGIPAPQEAEAYTVHPIAFIREHAAE